MVAGDLSGPAVDAIVNAANERLLGGGGVDGASRGRSRVAKSPATSCGVFGYPRDRATAFAVRESLSDARLRRRVVFCCFDDAMARDYRKLFG